MQSLIRTLLYNMVHLWTMVRWTAVNNMTSFLPDRWSERCCTIWFSLERRGKMDRKRLFYCEHPLPCFKQNDQVLSRTVVQNNDQNDVVPYVTRFPPWLWSKKDTKPWSEHCSIVERWFLWKISTTLRLSSPGCDDWNRQLPWYMHS